MEDRNSYINKSAKALVKGETSVSYICSRYYRAPELILNATTYSSAIGTTQTFHSSIVYVLISFLFFF